MRESETKTHILGMFYYQQHDWWGEAQFYKRGWREFKYQLYPHTQKPRYIECYKVVHDFVFGNQDKLYVKWGLG